jgi:uncharacterized protein
MRKTGLIIIILLLVIGGLVVTYPNVCTIINDNFEKITSGSGKKRFVSLGTGGVTGIYYPIGGEICRLVNREKEHHGLQCSIESTGGSVYNLNAISQGELDLGIAQSDLIYHAYHGTGQLKSIGKNENLRTVITLYTEPLTIVARDDSGVKNIFDLKNKRVNIGSPGSGQRATVKNLVEAIGWTFDDFAQISGLNPVEQSQALCDDKLDAIIFSVGHPNGSIQEAATSCKSHLVNIMGPQIEKMIEKRPYYVHATIPGKLYTGSPNDIKTFGGKVSLVTSDTVDRKLIYSVAKSIMENFSTFRRLHPVFSNLNKKAMVTEGVIAPIHEGAMQYYKEIGIL